MSHLITKLGCPINTDNFSSTSKADFLACFWRVNLGDASYFELMFSKGPLKKRERRNKVI